MSANRDSIVLGNYNRLSAKECIEHENEKECFERKYIPIEDVIIHEYFAKFTHEYDIALIRYDIHFCSNIRQVVK